jgi:hypothetical protein
MKSPNIILHGRHGLLMMMYFAATALAAAAPPQQFLQPQHRANNDGPEIDHAPIPAFNRYHGNNNNPPQQQQPIGKRTQHQFSSRSGNPLTSLLSKASTWFSSKMDDTDEDSAKNNLPPRMRDLHRVPKPPKYPLYDMDISATPPPAPLMHPMSSLPVQSEPFQQQHTYQQETSASNHHGNKLKPPPPGVNRRSNRPSAGGPPPQRMRRPPPPSNKNYHNHHGNGKKSRRPLHKDMLPPSHHHHHQSDLDSAGAAGTAPEYFSHPMASNLDPVKTSPALGRPLGFEEYMARPSHSYVNDPWNFDPFANQMNQGLNTHALKYNYDPLGNQNTIMIP